MKSSIITIYHGFERIIETPVFGAGRRNNDYGLGFYCTENKELAMEWAVSEQKNGFSNRYLLDTEYLKTLYLNGPDYTILNWVAVLLEHRVFLSSNPNAIKAKRYLIDNFALNVNAYDLVIGYRADDSYFDFAEAFLNNSITVNQLYSAMKLGNLGEQIVLKSEYAFSNLAFDGFETADWTKYFSQKLERNNSANQMYLNILEEDDDGLYVQDIIKEKITNDDERIPRNLCS